MIEEIIEGEKMRKGRKQLQDVIKLYVVALLLGIVFALVFCGTPRS